MARLRRQWGVQTRRITQPGSPPAEWRAPAWGWAEAEARAYIERRNRETPGGGRVVCRVLSDPIVVVEG